jgi:hypothetical protein
MGEPSTSKDNKSSPVLRVLHREDVITDEQEDAKMATVAAFTLLVLEDFRDECHFEGSFP